VPDARISPRLGIVAPSLIAVNPQPTEIAAELRIRQSTGL
jgi:hypothetical protein